MSKKKHPNKEIRKVLKLADENGFRLISSDGHPFGILYCSLKAREGCRMSIWSTPRNPQAHANDIEKFVKDCPHGDGE